VPVLAFTRSTSSVSPARRTDSTGRIRVATIRAPLGELVAQATGEGYRIGAGRTPFHGYYYKILTKQGSTAPGGALDYVVNGKMLGGFGLVAYPAEYGNSGVMTFLVNYNGVIFQKDLGPRTSWRAERITSFNPDQTWKKVAPGISP
jgi:hypothetical protein